MAKLSYANGVTSVIVRVLILDSTSTTGAGKTGLTEASAGLIIATIADNEATTTRYRASSSEVETISTIGTFAAPTSGKCRFKEVDATNHPGIYEIQIADARWGVSNARSIILSLTGATNMAPVHAEVQLDPVPADIRKYLGTASPAADTAGYPKVTVKSGTGTGELKLASGYVAMTWADIGSPTTTVNLSGTTIKTATDVETDTADIQSRLPAALTGDGNIKADVLAISGDIGAADNLEAAADGGSYNLGGGGIVAASVTGAVGSVTGAVGSVTGAVGSVIGNVGGNVTGSVGSVVATVSADVVSISGDGPAADNAEAFFDGTGYAGTNNVIPTVTTLTGHTPQTGDSYAIVNSVTHGNAAIKGYVDDIGTAGAGLTAVPWNAAWDAEVQSEVQDALEANNLDHLIKSAVDTNFATTVHLDSVIGQLADNGTTATFDRTTDSLEAVRDRGDAAWTTATGFSTLTAADVNTEVDTALADVGLTTTITGRIDVAISTRQATFTAATGVTFPANFGTLGINVSGHVSRVTLTDTCTTNTDMRGTDSALLAASAPANFSALGINASGHVSRVTLTDTMTTYTGNTPQTGDSYAIVNSGTFGNAAIKGYVDDIGAAGAGLTAIPWNAAWDAEVQSEVQDAIEVNNLDHLLKVAVDTDWATTVHLNSVVGNMADDGTTATFDRTTDSLEAIRNRGDSAWTTGGSSTLTAADVWTYGTRVLTAGTNIVLAKGTGITGFTDITASQVNAEVDTALTDVGLTTTVTGRIDVAVSTRGTGTALDASGVRSAVGLSTANLDTQLSAINTKTTNLPASPAAVGSAMTLTSGERSSTADALLARNIAGGSDGGRTVTSAFRAMRNKLAFDVPASGQFTVFQEDDTTAAFTGTYSVTVGASPVTIIDPAT